MNRNTAAEYPPISRLALAAIASNTGCTSDGELAMIFNISAVAACCSRASFRSWLGLEAERRFAGVAAAAMRCLALVPFRPFAGLASRAFALPVLPPVFDGRAISAPEGHEPHLIGLKPPSGRAHQAQSIFSCSHSCAYRRRHQTPERAARPREPVTTCETGG